MHNESIILKTQAISSIYGIANGRDAIYLDELIHTFSPSTLRFSGVMNSELCSLYAGSQEWLQYRLTFQHVYYFQCWNVDICPIRGTQSSFDVVQESELLDTLSLQNYSHYLLFTYDYVYSIVAKGHDWQVGIQ
jgi:hypothetical protein